MQVNQPLVSLISVNFNQADVTLDMIRSVMEEPYANKELIIVDNGSKENLGTLLPHEPMIKFIRSERNLGFAGGNNLAIPEAKGKYLFFINNDTELVPGSIATLVSYLEAHPKVGVVCPLICFYPRPEWKEEIIQFAAFTPLNLLTGRNKTVGKMEANKGQFSQPISTPYAHGAAMMVRAEVIPKAGLMDDHFFLYYEEMDWSARIIKAGYDVQTVPTAKIFHKESISVGRDSPLKTYFQTRNRIYFVKRNFRFLAQCAFFLFFALVTVPKNTLKLYLKGERPNLEAFWLAIRHHLNPNHPNQFEQLLVESKR